MTLSIKHSTLSVITILVCWICIWCPDREILFYFNFGLFFYIINSINIRDVITYVITKNINNAEETVPTSIVLKSFLNIFLVIIAYIFYIIGFVKLFSYFVNFYS